MAWGSALRGFDADSAVAVGGLLGGGEDCGERGVGALLARPEARMRRRPLPLTTPSEK